ncbi:MAG: helix-turn-helix domain-containing protein [Eubacteriales bacterium]|nr:helix-turn-helix domain-containing protein [Eubacteriales bacterium]
MNLTEALIAVGLTRLEAQLYLLLHSEGPMTGYEASKQSGISRSNAYSGLAGLAEKGAAVCVEGPVRQYSAVEAAEFCRYQSRRFKEIIAVIEDGMPEQRPAREPFLTISGRDPIIQKLKDMIGQAKQRIYLGLAAREIGMIRPEIETAVERGLKVVLLTSADVQIAGTIHYAAEKVPGQIRVIADSSVIMTGTLHDDQTSSCLFSRDQALVTLFKEAMANEIKLITMDQQITHVDRD